MQFRYLILGAAILVSTLPVTFGQAPDCTGISAVINTDPDLIGELNTVRVASGLQFPVFVTAAPGDNERLFILEKPGRIRIVLNGELQATPFLDIDAWVTGGTSTNDERGLLGLAFHPDYQNNNYFYVYYTATTPSGALTIARFERETDDVADDSSLSVVIQIPHPISNHNGGMIAFNPIDGHLYAGTGDGGSGCDPGAFPGNAQNLDSLLGKMLRLDVDGGPPYATDGNPYDEIAGADEIWSSGLRNPWRWSFDLLTGAQYIGDVGQETREELNCSPHGNSGQNYGWNAYEGLQCDRCNEWAESCPISLDNYVAPYREYSLSGTPCSVIGGYVYRGCRMPDLRGTYFYSDYCDDFVNTFRTDATCAAPASVNREIDLEPGGGVAISSIVSYGQDNQGEMYIVDQDGEVFKIIPEMTIMEVSGPGAAPLVLDDTGFAWEDLEQTSGVQTRGYRLFRAVDNVPGIGPSPFLCIAQRSAPNAAGDSDPPVGEVHYYLVTANNDGGDHSSPGTQSDGTPRVVDTTGPCNF